MKGSNRMQPCITIFQSISHRICKRRHLDIAAYAVWVKTHWNNHWLALTRFMLYYLINLGTWFRCVEFMFTIFIRTRNIHFFSFTYHSYHILSLNWVLKKWLMYFFFFQRGSTTFQKYTPLPLDWTFPNMCIHDIGCRLFMIF